MDTEYERAAVLWADLVAFADRPLHATEIADLFRLVWEASASQEVTARLGATHAVVQLATELVAGHRPDFEPDRAALAVVVGAYLVEPSLAERWFGYSSCPAEANALAALAVEAFREDVDYSGC